MLPRIIEFLAATQRPHGDTSAGGFLARQTTGQTLVPAFDPGDRITYTLTPSGSDYACIVHRVRFGAHVIPMMFEVVVQEVAHTIYSGTLGQAMIADGISAYMAITGANPMRIVVHNDGVLTQSFEVSYDYLLVGNRQDYENITKSLEDLQNKGWMGASQGLQAMARGRV